MIALLLTALLSGCHNAENQTESDNPGLTATPGKSPSSQQDVHASRHVQSEATATNVATAEEADGRFAGDVASPRRDSPLSADAGSKNGDQRSQEDLAAAADVHYQRALAAAKRQELAASKTEFEEALRLRPKFREAFRDYCALLLEAGYQADAVQLFHRQVEIWPEDPDAHNNYGVLLMRVADFPGALREFNEALELKPDHPDAHYNLGVALDTQGKTEAAIGQYRAAIGARPTYADARHHLGLDLLLQDKLAAAAEQFSEVLKMTNGTFRGAHYSYGIVLTRQGKKAAAFKQFTEAIRIEPKDADARYSLGLALVENGNEPQAIPQFSEVARLMPGHADAHFQLARILPRQGQLEEAIAHNQQALLLRPEWLDALNNLAWILATQDESKFYDPKRAVELAERARQLADYQKPSVLDTLSAAYAADGRWEDAIRVATEALESARSFHQEELAADIEKRLQGYRAGQPHRETPASTGP